jgi:hypothetical protein
MIYLIGHECAARSSPQQAHDIFVAVASCFTITSRFQKLEPGPPKDPLTKLSFTIAINIAGTQTLSVCNG